MLGAAHSGTDPQRHWPSTHVGPRLPQVLPHWPQCSLVFDRSTHLPPQQPKPAAHISPPQRHWPPTQERPSSHLLPIAPQLLLSTCGLTQEKPSPDATHICPTAHWSAAPHMQRGAPVSPAAVLHALARPSVQKLPQNPQCANEESERPSVPGETDTFTQAPAQQSWLAPQDCAQAVTPLSVPASRTATAPSATGMRPTHWLARQIWPAPQAMPQPPQLAGSRSVATHVGPLGKAQHAVAPAQAGSQPLVGCVVAPRPGLPSAQPKRSAPPRASMLKRVAKPTGNIDT